MLPPCTKKSLLAYFQTWVKPLPFCTTVGAVAGPVMKLTLSDARSKSHCVGAAVRAAANVPLAGLVCATRHFQRVLSVVSSARSPMA